MKTMESRLGRLLGLLTILIGLSTPAQSRAELPRYSILDGCRLVFRLITGGRGPTRVATRHELRRALQDSPAVVTAKLKAISNELERLAVADNLDDQWRKDLLLFLGEMPSAMREHLEPAEIYKLFRQNESLYSGDFRNASPLARPDAASDFLQAFWTPKTEIVGAVEKGDDLFVYTHKNYEVSVNMALPRTFRGKNIRVVPTDRESSIVDARWFRHNKDGYYSNRPVLLLTGATSGLGLALAKRLVDSGDYRVVLTGRESSLHELRNAGLVEGPNVIIRPMDVADSGQRDKVMNEITEKWGGVDMLVNNASITSRGPLETTADETIRRQMEVDYFGPRALMQAAVPLMRMRGRGRIMNVSSANGQFALPFTGGYSASKHALEGETEALAAELKPYGVGVSLVQPGLFQSSGIAKIQDLPATGATNPYAKGQASLNDFMLWNLARTGATVDTVADKLVADLKKDQPKLRLRPTSEGWAMLKMKEVLPHGLFHWMMRRWYPDYRNWHPIDPPAGR